MAFPTSPSNNDVHKEGTRSFVWDSTLGVWDQVRETDRSENKTITSGAVAQGNLSVVGDLVPSTPLSHRNMFINGAMNVMQRTSGTGYGTFTHADIGSSNGYHMDRWKYMAGYGTPAQRFTVSRSAVGNADQIGFKNSLKADCTTVESNLGSNTSRYSGIFQLLEYQNLDGLLYGTAAAKTLTLSFWVKSGLTGTHGISVMINNGGAALPQTYSVSTANTWEYKQVTIAGNTSTAIGTTEYGMAVGFLFNLGTSQLSGTQNTWGSIVGYTAVADIMGSTAYDFYITGVQLEVGSNATPFEYRSYGDELIRCQRYTVRFGGTTSYDFLGHGGYNTATKCTVQLPSPMRAEPIVESVGAVGGWGSSNYATSSVAMTAIAKAGSLHNLHSITLDCTWSGGILGNFYAVHGQATDSGKIIITAEL